MGFGRLAGRRAESRVQLKQRIVADLVIVEIFDDRIDLIHPALYSDFVVRKFDTFSTFSFTSHKQAFVVPLVDQDETRENKNDGQQVCSELKHLQKQVDVRCSHRET